MRRTLCLTLIAICFGTIQTRSQACGYVYAQIYVDDSRGVPIRNVRFEFLENQDRKKWAVHGREVVKWVDQDSRYFLEEGMCGGHRDVLVTVSADGFKDATNVVDLRLRNPSRPYMFKIILARKGTKIESSFTTHSFPPDTPDVE